jgi:NAD(P)-dependent dehydrogenase (short-subunit alcohol dehydrogenase family)
VDLRYRLAVVTGAGGCWGREIAVALSRVGAAVLATDRDLVAAEETASQVRAARVRAWALQVDVTVDTDLQMLAARAHDLGGMDLLVTCGTALPAQRRLTKLFVDGLVQRRGRRDGTPAAVNVGEVGGGEASAGSPDDVAATTQLVRYTRSVAEPASYAGARVMAVVPGPAGWDGTTASAPDEVARVVLELLSRGAAGEVAELTDEGPTSRRPLPRG